MTEQHDAPDVDWDGHKELKNFKTDNLDTIWSFLWQHLRDEGRVIAYDLRENHDLGQFDYAEDTVYANILPKMREYLSELGIIEVEEETSEKFSSVKKIWRLPE